MRELIESLRRLSTVSGRPFTVSERAEAAIAMSQAAAALEAAQESACVALVADIRFACGDNGKRMQPELVEFIRGLAEDARRLDALESLVAAQPDRALLLHHGMRLRGAESHAGLGLSNTNRTLRQAIDQARGKRVA